ncbi:MAG: ABC transporter permease [Anaerolineales bacterium]|nr:ABC transporter permease [Anaerolineales bacterium]
MNKTLLVLKNEIITLVSRPSFWLSTLGIPLAGALIFAVVGWINRDAGTAAAVGELFRGPQEVRPEGYVDLGGIIEEMPETVPAGTFVAYPDEASARAALDSGEIAAFYIVPADHLRSGEITCIRPDFNPLASDSNQSGLFRWVLQVNLVDGDILLSNLVNGPLDVQDISLAPAGTAEGGMDNPLTMWTPYAVTLIFYFLIMGSASLLLSNISKEKENRIVEILLTSVNPHQLLAGKIIGLGIVGLLQTLLWVTIASALANRSGQIFQVASSLHLPASFIVWGLVFFVLGYAVYASLMAGLGALAPNLREASQVTFVIMLPLIIPLFFSNNVFAVEPNGPIATVLSLFPLSAPVAMMARLPAGGVPWWHPPLAAVLLALTAWLIVRMVAGMFRAQALLSGQPIQVKTYFRALFGKL